MSPLRVSSAAHGHRVGRLPAPVEVENDLVDDLVGGPVVVVRLDHIEHVRDRVLRQHHAAQHALLGGEIVRRRPLELLAPRHDLRNAHRCVSPLKPARAGHPRPKSPCWPNTGLDAPAIAEDTFWHAIGTRNSCQFRISRHQIPCLFYRTPPTVFSVSRKPSSHRVHRPVDRLCRHAGSAVRSLGIRLWKQLGITANWRPGLRERSAQGVHTRFFDPVRTCLARASYPHWEFDVQRHPRASPGLAGAASRSADLACGPTREQLQFEYVFEGWIGLGVRDRHGGRSRQGSRRSCGGDQRGRRRGRPGVRRATGWRVGDDYGR